METESERIELRQEILLNTLPFLLLASLGFFFPRSKFVFFIELVVLICFLGGYNGDADMISYRIRFETEASSDAFTESLFYALSSLLHRLEFSFEAYHLILTALSLSLIAYVIAQLSEKPAMSIAMMWGYATLEYAVQLQGLCAAACVIYTLYYYFKRIYSARPKARHYATFIILLLMCMAMHFYAAFFIMFLALKRVSKFTICLFAFGWLISVYPLLNALFAYAGQFVAGTREYAEIRLGAKSFVCFCLWLVFGVCCAVHNSRLVRKLRYEREISAFSQFAEKGSLLMLMILPFFGITSSFERIFRIWIPFLYIQLSFFHAGKFKRYLSEFIFLTYSIGTFALFYVIFLYNNFSICLEIMRHNLFWQLP